tara:strand:+ start:1348 stop:1578 length:231 start_codon:yes stop_codon:yes gene_type:complete
VEYSNKILIKELGKRISFYIKQKGLKQAHLSDLADIKESAVRRIELGKTNPTFKTLQRISLGLEISHKELIDLPMS